MSEPIDWDGDDAPYVFDVDYDPDAVAAWAASADPGQGILTPFGVLDPGGLSHGGRVDLIIALERTRAWLDAQQQRVLALMAADPVPHPSLEHAQAKEWVREEVACALAIAPRTAASRLHDATELVTRLPATLAMIEAGDLSLLHGRVLVETVRSLTDAVTAQIEARVLPRAKGQTISQFRQSVKRAALSIDPGAAETQHCDALAGRRVAFYPDEHGMAAIWSSHRADHAAQILAAVNLRAEAMNSPDDDRTADQRRADALRDLILGGGRAERTQRGANLHEPNLHDPNLHDPNDRSANEPGANEPGANECGTAGASGRAGTGTRGPAVNITVTLSSLLALDQQPGELAGYGPVPASLARAIALQPDATWRRVITDDHGHLLDYGRTTYRPPAALADHLRARDHSCRFPVCNRCARHADLDHIIAWADGGPTSEANMHALCRRNHVLKHEAGWSITRLDDGASRWRSPTGHVYDKPPHTLPIDTTIDALTQAADTDPDPPPF
ncbi:MAG TPA: DUF222 domain-containing protein [Jatrophihabitans sp.]|jgi:hypothetical protein|nr:DUF222 domain-containing protein [Jatrophihabitans sp.]